LHVGLLHTTEVLDVGIFCTSTVYGWNYAEVNVAYSGRIIVVSIQYSITLARDAQAKLALIVAQICRSVCLSATA